MAPGGLPFCSQHPQGRVQGPHPFQAARSLGGRGATMRGRRHLACTGRGGQADWHGGRAAFQTDRNLTLVRPPRWLSWDIRRLAPSGQALRPTAELSLCALGEKASCCLGRKPRRLPGSEARQDPASGISPTATPTALVPSSGISRPLPGVPPLLRPPTLPG